MRAQCVRIGMSSASYLRKGAKIRREQERRRLGTLRWSVTTTTANMFLVEHRANNLQNIVDGMVSSMTLAVAHVRAEFANVLDVLSAHARRSRLRLLAAHALSKRYDDLVDIASANADMLRACAAAARRGLRIALLTRRVLNAGLNVLHFSSPSYAQVCTHELECVKILDWKCVARGGLDCMDITVHVALRDVHGMPVVDYDLPGVQIVGAGRVGSLHGQIDGVYQFRSMHIASFHNIALQLVFPSGTAIKLPNPLRKLISKK